MALIDDILPSLNVIIQGLAKHFGDTTEFVVHDFRGGQELEHTIVSIINGHVTGRRLGSSVLEIELNPMAKTYLTATTHEGLFNCITRTPDGRTLKSSMIYLRDETDTVQGAVSVSCDITKLQLAKNSIDDYVGVCAADMSGGSAASSIDDFLVSLIYESIDMIGVPVTFMTREQKMAGIKFLKERGAFKITKASEIIAKYYDISKYTVYNYLSEASEPAEEESEECPAAQEQQEEQQEEEQQEQ
ncbi:MAG: helix-turn-helix transcriptional regulator [Oscillospiraceae bacterium]|nr:helix-turn-helix transcriptional regulator [Oscillospiraceae bacterium]